MKNERIKLAGVVVLLLLFAFVFYLANCPGRFQ
jgi:hypothetical protein